MKLDSGVNFQNPESLQDLKNWGATAILVSPRSATRVVILFQDYSPIEVTMNINLHDLRELLRVMREARIQGMDAGKAMLRTQLKQLLALGKA